MKKVSSKSLKDNIKSNSNLINYSNLPRIRVCVRKRPANKKEIQNNDIDILEILNNNSLVVKELK